MKGQTMGIKNDSGWKTNYRNQKLQEVEDTLDKVEESESCQIKEIKTKPQEAANTGREDKAWLINMHLIHAWRYFI